MSQTCFRLAACAARSLAVLVVVVIAAESRAEGPEPVDFNRDIRPILSDTCYTCHGPDEGQRQTEMRLDTKQGAFADLGGYRALVPGKPQASELYRRVSSNDDAVKMPPPDSGRELSAEQVELFRRWIEEGAKWQTHWSFVPPERPKLPQVKNEDWVRNGIDYFVLRRLKAAGLEPNAEASKETLIRRVTLDLTGLPPTLEEIDAFLADDAPGAYDRVVDRLLASPRYGERMAVPWLDAARYSDTNGYQRDATRTMWPWRDWVIRAMNANMPFDQFTIEQIAGDLLRGATRRQKLATGFNRNHMLNGEGGRIAEESRVEYVVDRVDTTSTVWLGLTVGCGRCHDHKYDPIRQDEFYAIYAYFNSISETGRVDRGGNAAPVMRIPSEQQQQQLAELDRQIAGLEKELAEPPSDERLAQWEQEKLREVEAAAGKPAWHLARAEQFSSRAGAKMERLEDGSIFVSGKNPANDVYEVTLRTELEMVTGLRLEALTHESFTDGGLARSDSGNFVLTGLEVELQPAGGKPQPVKIAEATADFEQGGHPVKHVFDGNPRTGWAVYKPGDMRHDRTAVFRFAEPFAAGKAARLVLRLEHESPHQQHNLGRFRLALTSRAEPGLKDDEGGVPADVVAALRTVRADRSREQTQALLAYYRKTAPEKRKVHSELNRTKKRREQVEKAIPETMVMEDLKEPRDTYVLLRGQYDKPDKSRPVEPGVPACLHALPEDAPRNRLGLARWLVDPANPLTARVTVNRYWQHFFGTGLVKTAEDFGAQGAAPSHPALLDWLATEFVAGGWNIKAIHKQIVTSAAYRQSSEVTPAKEQRDPYNRLISRGPRLRLGSFAIRDQALALAGLLVDSVGGPPVKPYQPEGIWLDFSLGKIKYVQDHGDKLYRRSLYTFWRRSVGPPMLFDTSSRQVCTVRQSRTNTPLHALVLMNDKTFVEAARKFAERVMRSAQSPEERVETAFRMATARRPSDAEKKVLLGAYERVRKHYRDNPEEAGKLLEVGEAPRDETLDTVELAAWTGVVTVVMNLDEVITKE